MKMVYWDIPLKRDWLQYATAAIIVVERASRRLVMQTAGISPVDLKHARSIVRLHNQHVKAQLTAKKAQHGKNQNSSK